MSVELTQEQVQISSETLRGNYSRTSGHHHDTEYELDQSESLTFLYNLLYDDNSILSKSDILKVLNALKTREETLPFSFTSGTPTDVQGVTWPPGLKQKFNTDRRRIGSNNWFRNYPESFERSSQKVNINYSKTSTEFFKFDKFYSKLKLHITHFQLRNLVCCNNLSNGIFYPSNYYHDHNLQVVNNVELGLDSSYHSFFRINRLMKDYDVLDSDSMKLNCVIDSRALPKNSNSRISTLACSDNFLVSGTFEGGYILTQLNYDGAGAVTDSEINEDFRTVGEFDLTSSYDGITNSVLINDDRELIISSNDKYIRYVDILTGNKTQEVELPFAGNCLSMNSSNPNEIFISGDSLDSYIYDRRTDFNKTNEFTRFEGQEDFSFSCDWCPTNENYLLTGNQDGNVRVWDKRLGGSPLFCWGSDLSGAGPNQSVAGPVRNTKFSRNGDFICWAESLDHVGLVNFNDLNLTNNLVDRIQSIDFIGKCTGLNFCNTNNGYDEKLIIGVNDCPLGGILSYNLESDKKCLDYDF